MIERLKFRGKLSRAINNFNAAYEKIPKGTWMYTGFGETEGWEKMTYEEQYAHLTVVTFFQWVESRIIDPATVGQWTGLKDRNGVDIYEGDIVEHEDSYGNNLPEYSQFEVVYGNGGGSFYLAYIGDDGDDEYSSVISIRPIRVIGNIHEEK